MKTTTIYKRILTLTKLFPLTFFFLAIAENINAQNIGSPKPNIVIVYVDDLGYGDVGCYGATAVKTPNVDYLAANGLKFTDAHCTAATCTPSRYSLLTGSYAFRNNAAILPGDAPLIMRPGMPTLPSMLQKAGYITGIVGKWHLGLGDGNPNWNGDLKPGPMEVGFNYSFIVPATLDRVPTVFVEGHHVVNLDPKDPIVVNYDHKVGNLPTGTEDPELLKFKGDPQHSNTITDSISRIGFMYGGAAALWKDEEMADVLMGKVKSFISENKSKPFFLYFSFTDIHVPRDPNRRFVGKTTMGSRGDAIAQMDWSTGTLMKTLDSLGLSKNTIIIFTSDNGPVLDDGYEDFAEELVGDHKPGGPFKGGKYSEYEAGTRVPTIVYWPGKVKPGVSTALVNQVDFYASFAAMLHQPIQKDAAPDSYNMLKALMGRSRNGRNEMMEESFTVGLRYGQWKYIAPQTKPTPDWLKNKTIATGLSTTAQLYNLNKDITEHTNLVESNPGMAAKLNAKLRAVQTAPGSRVGYLKSN